MNKVVSLITQGAAQVLLMLLFGLVSPGWWLTHQVLSAYFDVNALLQALASPMGFLELVAAMRALGPQTVWMSLMPALLACLAFNLLYLWLAGRLAGRIRAGVGQKLAVLFNA